MEDKVKRKKYQIFLPALATDEPIFECENEEQIKRSFALMVESCTPEISLELHVDGVKKEEKFGEYKDQATYIKMVKEYINHKKKEDDKL